VIDLKQASIDVYPSERHSFTYSHACDRKKQYKQSQLFIFQLPKNCSDLLNTQSRFIDLRRFGLVKLWSDRAAVDIVKLFGKIEHLPKQTIEPLERCGRKFRSYPVEEFADTYRAYIAESQVSETWKQMILDQRKSEISWVQLGLNLLRESTKHLNLLFESGGSGFYFRWA